MKSRGLGDVYKRQLGDPTHIFDPRKSYVLVGGCGGLGPRLAGFLINYGARNIIMTGRRGHISRSDRLALERLVSDPAFPHVTIKIMAADALKPEAMREVFATANSLGPLGGIFLMSVVLRDDQFLLSLIHISEPTRLHKVSRMPSSA